MKTRRKILILTVGAALFFAIPVRDAAAQDDHRYADAESNANPEAFADRHAETVAYSVAA